MNYEVVYLHIPSVVGLSITTLRKVDCGVCQRIFSFKSVNICQRYKQEGGCLVRLVRLAITPLKDEKFTRYLECGEKQPLLTAVTPLLMLPE